MRTIAKELGDCIRMAREELGVRQDFIAVRLGVSRQAVSQWELGHAMPSALSLLLLIEIFDGAMLLPKPFELSFAPPREAA